MMRECKKNDFFTVSILKYWSQEYEDDLATLLKNMLTKSVNTPNKKRNRYIRIYRIQNYSKTFDRKVKQYYLIKTIVIISLHVIKI